MADLVEDFEDTTYVVPISGTWARSNSRAHTGTWSFKSAVIADGESTEAVFTVPADALTVTFWRRLSSEPGQDFLRFFLDTTQQFASSGDVDWILSPTYNVSAVSTITFRYSKSAAGSVGDDAAYIDDVTFTFPVNLVSAATINRLMLYRGQPGTSSATLFTATTDTKIASIVLCNTTGNNATVTLSVVNSGGGTNRIVSELVPANGISIINSSIYMTAGDFIAGLQGTASAITVSVSGETYA